MRTQLLPIAFLLLAAPLRAQLFAGEVPPGTTAYPVGIDLELSTVFTADSADMEFDCDDFMDAWAVLLRGYPEVDAPNIAMIDFVDDDIEVCMDMSPSTGFQPRPRYYSFGEALDCSGELDWQLADPLVLGDFGGFMAVGPWSIDSMYIAYRRGSTLGWMLLSFELNAQTVRLQVHQLLSICGGTSAIAPNEVPAPVALFPNPTHGGTLRVSSMDVLRRIEVLDAAGRIIAQYNGSVRAIDAPEIAGSYFVRTIHADGRRSMTRIVRQ